MNDLRRRAEDLINADPIVVPDTPAADAQKLVHELQVHQVEMGMQNEELRRVNLELSDSHDRYVELYDFAPVGYVTIDRGGLILESNLAAATMLGMERLAIIGRKKLSDFVSGEAQDEWFLYQRYLFERNERERSKSVASSGPHGTVELAFRGRDGAPFFVRLECVPLGRGSGPAQQVLVALTDITEQRQLQRRIEYLSRFPSENPNPVMRIHADGLVKYANAAAMPILDAWQTCTGKKAPSLWQEQVARSIRDGIPVVQELKVGAASYSVCIAPVREHNYANLYGTDITELNALHRREQAAAGARMALDTINAMREGLLLIAMDGTVRSVNPAMSELSGYAGTDLARKHATELIELLLDPADRDPARRALAAAMAGDATAVPEMTLVSRDLRRMPILPRVSFIEDDSGSPETIVLTIQDISDIAAANRSVREEAERLAEAQRIAHVGNWDWDIAADTLTWSDEIYRMFGLAPTTSIATHEAFLSLVHPDDRRFVDESMDQALHENHQYSIDHRILLPDATERTVHQEAEVHFNAAGRAVRMTGTVQDITVRKHAEDRNRITGTLSRLFAERNTLGRYLEAATDVLRNWSGCRCLGIRVLKENGEIPYESWLGFSPEFVESESCLSASMNQCICSRAMTGRSEPQDVPCLTPTGSFFCNDVGEFLANLCETEKTRFRGVCAASGFRSVAVIPLRYQGKVLGAIHAADERRGRVQLETVAFIENISPLIAEAMHRFSVEEQLHSSESKYRLLVENIPAVTYAARADRARSTTYVSPQVAAVLGYSPAEFAADPDMWLKHLHPDDRDRVLAELEQANGDTGRFVLEYRMTTCNGQTVWLRDRGSLVPGESGREAYVQGVMYDITEQRRTDEALRSLAAELALAEERERKQLAIAIHDTVSQTLALAKIKLGGLNRMLDSEEARSALTEVRALFSRAVGQTRSLSFELSPPILYELGLHAAVDWLGETLGRQYGYEFSFSGDDDSKVASESLRILMFQSIRELLTNAGKHAGARRVSVTLERTNGGIVAVIADDGIGFDLEAVRRSPQEKQSIGLFSVAERMRHVGGSFRVECEPGQGTKVTLSVPLKAEDRGTGDKQ